MNVEPEKLFRAIDFAFNVNHAWITIGATIGTIGAVIAAIRWLYSSDDSEPQPPQD